MTTLIATSVIRGSHQGESHGGVYLIDLDKKLVVQPLDWNTTDIDWQGRGWDRGLRGIAFDRDRVYIAASDELFVYTPDFEKISSHRNPFLKHCHEIFCYQRRLFLTSTGFDSVLGFDLDNDVFAWGLHLTKTGESVRGAPFDPVGLDGPPPSNDLHLNNIHCTDTGMYISGLRTGGLLAFDGRRITQRTTLPQGVHNARPYRDGVLFNDTQADVVRFASPNAEQSFAIPRYPPDKLTHAELDDSRIARQAFGRGLCTVDENVIASGSSPSTITLHDLANNKSTTQVTLTFDIRNAIHGLEVWPYS